MKVSFVGQHSKAHIGVKLDTLKRMEPTMFEATTNPAARNAMQNAHAARGAAMFGFFSWLRRPARR
ncbi:hypothetical protein KDD17_11365 [Sulfitobacter albidus]|uniref:Uncharacterized protein n=1 Tax=Sulfitobacter albidus TaxID=2829501 RepID=A0A975PLD7_9RHOB|nr:hypothetical protein [Sulfitobacter albidus]QUJ75559.1 hypothetical protein KDD17_11365 [Sulfitobacter albidus]